jgi:CBS domain-containing protein
MVPADRLHAARPEQSLNEVLPLMTGNDVNQLPVVDTTGRLVGILTRNAVLRYVEVRRGLGLDQAEPRQPAAGPSPPENLPAPS